jgi:hypothetical protein
MRLLKACATVLVVYKPCGLTPYGRRKQHERRTGSGGMPKDRAGQRQTGFNYAGGTLVQIDPLCHRRHAIVIDGKHHVIALLGQ